MRQVGDVIEIVFRNSLPNAVNLVFNGGLIPDDPSFLTAAISPGQTVRDHETLAPRDEPWPMGVVVVVQLYTLPAWKPLLTTRDIALEPPDKES